MDACRREGYTSRSAVVRRAITSLALPRPDARPTPDPRKTRQPATVTLDGEAEAHFRRVGVVYYPEEDVSYKAETEIQDFGELRKHGIEVHWEAYQVSACLLMC